MDYSEEDHAQSEVDLTESENMYTVEPLPATKPFSFTSNVMGLLNSTKSYLTLNKNNSNQSLIRVPSISSRNTSPESYSRQGTPSSRKNSAILDLVRRTSCTSQTPEPPIQLPDEALKGLTEEEVNHISSVLKNANESVARSPRMSVQYENLNMNNLNVDEQKHIQEVLKKASQREAEFMSGHYYDKNIQQPIVSEQNFNTNVSNDNVSNMNKDNNLTEEELEHIQRIARLAEMDDAMNMNSISTFKEKMPSETIYGEEIKDMKTQRPVIRVQMPTELKSTSIKSYDSSLDLTQEEIDHINKINKLAESDIAMDVFYGRKSLDKQDIDLQNNELTAEELEHIRKVNEMAMKEIDESCYNKSYNNDSIASTSEYYNTSSGYKVEEKSHDIPHKINTYNDENVLGEYMIKPIYSSDSSEETDSADEVLADDELYDFSYTDKESSEEYQLTEEELNHIKKIQELAEQENISYNYIPQEIKEERPINVFKKEPSLTREEIEHIRRIQEMADYDATTTAIKSPVREETSGITYGNKINTSYENELTEEELKNIQRIQDKILEEEINNAPRDITLQLEEKTITPECHKLTEEEIAHIRKIQEMAEMDDITSYQKPLTEKIKKYNPSFSDYENDIITNENMSNESLSNNYIENDVSDIRYRGLSEAEMEHIKRIEEMSIADEVYNKASLNQNQISTTYNISLPPDIIDSKKMHESLDSSFTLDSINSSFKKEYTLSNKKRETSYSSKFASTDTGNFSDYSDDSNQSNKKYITQKSNKMLISSSFDPIRLSKLKRSRSLECLSLIESDNDNDMTYFSQVRYSLPTNLMQNSKEYMENAQETEKILAQIQQLNQPEYINKIFDVEEEYQNKKNLLKDKKEIADDVNESHGEYYFSKSSKIAHPITSSQGDKKYMEFSSTSILGEEIENKNLNKINSSIKEDENEIVSNSYLSSVNKDKAGGHTFMTHEQSKKNIDAELHPLLSHNSDLDISKSLQQINCENLALIPDGLYSAENGAREQAKQTSCNQASTIAFDHIYHQKESTFTHILPINSVPDNISLSDHQLPQNISTKRSNSIEEENVVENSNIDKPYYSSYSYAQLSNKNVGSKTAKENFHTGTCEETYNTDLYTNIVGKIVENKEFSTSNLGIPIKTQEQVLNFTNEVSENNLTSSKNSNEDLIGYSGSEKINKFGGVSLPKVDNISFAKPNITMFKSSNSGFSRFGSLGKLANAALSSAQKAGEQLTAAANNAVAQATSMDNITSIGQNTQQSSTISSTSTRSQSAFNVSEGGGQGKQENMPSNYISNTVSKNIPNPIELPPGIEDLSDEERRQILAVLMQAEEINNSEFISKTQPSIKDKRTINEIPIQKDIEKQDNNLKNIVNENIITDKMPSPSNNIYSSTQIKNIERVNNEMYSNSTSTSSQIQETTNLLENLQTDKQKEYTQSQINNKQKEYSYQTPNDSVIYESDKNRHMTGYSMPFEGNNDFNEIKNKDKYEESNIQRKEKDSINNYMIDNYIDANYNSTEEEVPTSITSGYTYDNDVISNVSPQYDYYDDHAIKQFESIERDTYNSMTTSQGDSVNLILSQNDKNNMMRNVDAVELSEPPYSYDDVEDLDNIKLESVYTMKKPRMWTTVFTDENDSEDGINETATTPININEKNQDWLLEDSSCQPLMTDDRINPLNLMGNSDEGYEIEMDDPLSQEMVVTNSQNINKPGYTQRTMNIDTSTPVKRHSLTETPVIMVTSAKDEQHVHKYDDSSEGETSPSSDEDDYPDNVIEVPTITPAMNYEDSTENEKKLALERELIQQIQSFGEAANDEFDVRWKSENEAKDNNIIDNNKDGSNENLNRSPGINRINPFMDDSKLNDFTANDASTSYEDDLLKKDITNYVPLITSSGKPGQEELKNKNNSVHIMRPGPVYTIPESNEEESFNNTEGKYIAHKIERKPLRVSMSELDKYQLGKTNNQTTKNVYTDLSMTSSQNRDYSDYKEKSENVKITSDGQIKEKNNISKHLSNIPSFKKSPVPLTHKQDPTTSTITAYAEQTNKRLKELEERLEMKTNKDIETVKKQLDQLLQQGGVVKHDKIISSDITDGASIYDGSRLKYKSGNGKNYENDYLQSQESSQSHDYPNLFPKLLDNATEKDIIEASLMNDNDNSFAKLKRSPAMILTSEDALTSAKPTSQIDKSQANINKGDDENLSQTITTSETGRRKLPSLPIQHQSLAQQRANIASLYSSTSLANIIGTPSGSETSREITLTFDDLAQFSLHPNGLSSISNMSEDRKRKNLPSTLKMSSSVCDSMIRLSQDNYALSTKVGLNNASKIVFTKEPNIHPGAAFRNPNSISQQQMFMMPSVMQAQKLSTQSDSFYDSSNKSSTLPLNLSSTKGRIQHSVLTQPIEKQQKMCDIMARVAFKKELREKLAKRLLLNDKTEIEANQRNYKINKMYTTGIVTEIRPPELNLIPDIIKSDLPEEITKNARVTKPKETLDNIDTFGSLKTSFDEFDSKMRQLYNYSAHTLPTYQLSSFEPSTPVVPVNKVTSISNLFTSTKSVACQCDTIPSNTTKKVCLEAETQTNVLDILTLPVYQKSSKVTENRKQHESISIDDECLNNMRQTQTYNVKNNAECQTDVTLPSNKRTGQKQYRSIPNLSQYDNLLDDSINIFDPKTGFIKSNLNDGINKNIDYDGIGVTHMTNLPYSSLNQLNNFETDYLTSRNDINRLRNINTRQTYNSLGTLNINTEEDLEYKQLDAMNEIAKRKEKMNTLKRIRNINAGSNYALNRRFIQPSINSYNNQLYETDYSSTVPHYSSMPMLTETDTYGLSGSILQDALRNPYSTLGRRYRDQHISRNIDNLRNVETNMNYHSSLPRNYGLNRTYDQTTNLLGYPNSQLSRHDMVNRPYLSKSVYDFNTGGGMSYNMSGNQRYGNLMVPNILDNRRSNLLNRNLSRSFGGLEDPYYQNNLFRHSNQSNIPQQQGEIQNEMLSEYANYLNKHYMTGGNVDLMDDSNICRQGQIPETDLVFDNQNCLPYYDDNMSNVRTNIPMDTFQNYYKSATLPSQVYSRKEVNYGARPFYRVGEYGNGYRESYLQMQPSSTGNQIDHQQDQSREKITQYNKNITDEINARLKEDPLSKVYATIGQNNYRRNLYDQFDNRSYMSNSNLNDQQTNFGQKSMYIPYTSVFKKPGIYDSSNINNDLYGRNYKESYVNRNYENNYNPTKKGLSMVNISMPEDLPMKRRLRESSIKRILLTRKYKNSNFFNDIGIRITGGKKLADGDLGAFITAINKQHCYETLGEIQEGDQVLAINDISLCNKSYEEVERILNATKGELEIVIQPKKKGEMSEYNNDRMYDDVAESNLRKPLKSTLKKTSNRSNRQVYYEDSTIEGDRVKEAPPIPAHRHEVAMQQYEIGNNEYARKYGYNFSPKKISKSLTNGNGYLQVALAYDLSQNLLFVTIVAARNLKMKSTYDSIVLPNPFVKIYLLPNRKVSSKRRTKYIPNTSDPVWNQTVEYHVPYERLSSQWLEFTVWDYDKYSDSLSLGQVIIALSDSQLFNNQPRWYPLQSTRNQTSIPMINNSFNTNQSFSRNLNKPSFVKGNTYHYNPNYLDINYPAIC
uniref:PH domain-containing protein n=1 Tax=Parastrongyloides trichosuri TaxID=131310 RepID=A0A0N4ZCD6_PARTI